MILGLVVLIIVAVEVTMMMIEWAVLMLIAFARFVGWALGKLTRE